VVEVATCLLFLSALIEEKLPALLASALEPLINLLTLDLSPTKHSIPSLSLTFLHGSGLGNSKPLSATPYPRSPLIIHNILLDMPQYDLYKEPNRGALPSFRGFYLLGRAELALRAE
jgi:hypothetical protein